MDFCGFAEVFSIRCLHMKQVPIRPMKKVCEKSVNCGKLYLTQETDFLWGNEEGADK